MRLPLSPGIDRGRTSQDDRSICETNGAGNTTHLNVVENQRTIERTAAGCRAPQEYRCVRHSHVDDGLSPDSLGSVSVRATGVDIARRDVETNGTVVDRDALPGPPPVPCGEYRGLRVVDSNVANGELLVSDPDTILSTVEDQIAHEPSGSILHIDSLVGCGGVSRHVDYNIVERSRLRDLPVQAGSRSRGRLRSKVDMYVPNTPIEVILGGSDLVSRARKSVLDAEKDSLG